MKIAVYAIAKNEERHIAQWEACTRDADYRVILDTGSTDNTISVAQKLGLRIEQQVFTPFRFCDARNAALALVPTDAHFCVNLDLDEILHPGWYDALQKLPPIVTRPTYKYIWSRNEDGSEGLVYSGHSIHHRHNYEWQYPVHELVTPTGKELRAWCDLVAEHQPDANKSRKQYLPMLKQFVLDEPDSDRAAFYYARELFFHGHLDEAGDEFERHLALPNAVWAPERASSYRHLAKCRPDHAEAFLLRAACEAPEFREAWVDLAQHYYDKANWRGCYYAATQALSITDKPLEYFCEAYAWHDKPYDLAALGAYNLGLSDEALSYGQIAAQLNPTDPRLVDNVEWYRKAAGKVSTHD